MRFYLDNEAQTLTPEVCRFLSLFLSYSLRTNADLHFRLSRSLQEIILHTLFENGTTEIKQLDRYIKDDVEQYGSKLSDLSKKMQQAYLESAEVPVVEDESIFNGDGEVFAK